MKLSLFQRIILHTEYHLSQVSLSVPRAHKAVARQSVVREPGNGGGPYWSNFATITYIARGVDVLLDTSKPKRCIRSGFPEKPKLGKNNQK